MRCHWRCEAPRRLKVEHRLCEWIVKIDGGILGLIDISANDKVCTSGPSLAHGFAGSLTLAFLGGGGV